MVFKTKEIKILTRVLSVVLCALSLLFSWYCAGTLIQTIRLLNANIMLIDGAYTLVEGSSSLKTSFPCLFPLLLYIAAGLISAVAAVFSFLRSASHVRLLRILYGIETICLACGMIYLLIMQPLMETHLLLEFMTWRYFSPFGLFGEDGIDLSGLIGDFYTYIKYLLWGILAALSAVLSFIWSSVRISRHSHSSAGIQAR